MKIINRPVNNNNAPFIIKTETTNLKVELQDEEGNTISTHTVAQISITEEQ